MSSLRLIDEMVPASIMWDKKISRVGLDGKGIGKRRQVFNVTNLSENQVIGIFPNLTQQQLKKELLKVKEEYRLAVKEVCIDMDVFFVSIIKECFPNAKLVIDHFHVIQLAIRLIKDQKRILQFTHKDKFPIDYLLGIPAHKLTRQEFEKLNEYFKKAPRLKESWKIIHQLRTVYWQANCKDAYKRLRHVIRLCKRSGIWQMKDLAKTLERWQIGILNYYISKTTNAYTEGIHNHFERIKRNHFGIKNMDRFCKRLLFCLTPMAIFLEIFVQRC